MDCLQHEYYTILAVQQKIYSLLLLNKNYYSCRKTSLYSGTRLGPLPSTAAKGPKKGRKEEPSALLFPCCWRKEEQDEEEEENERTRGGERKLVQPQRTVQRRALWTCTKKCNTTVHIHSLSFLYYTKYFSYRLLIRRFGQRIQPPPVSPPHF